MLYVVGGKLQADHLIHLMPVEKSEIFILPDINASIDLLVRPKSKWHGYSFHHVAGISQRNEQAVNEILGTSVNERRLDRGKCDLHAFRAITA